MLFRLGGVVGLSLAFYARPRFRPLPKSGIFVMQKIDSSHVIRIIRAQVPPSRKKTVRQNYHWVIGVRLYGVKLKTDSSFRERTRLLIDVAGTAALHVSRERSDDDCLQTERWSLRSSHTIYLESYQRNEWQG
ncbi:hypothetical protein TNCV_1944021 [Trichonephila clavipes]|nr:hypothetical protein TNCV_1944021 [Trichonephila clavipes]